MSHTITDQELMEELRLRFERSRKAFADLTTVNLRLRELNRKLEQSERLKSNFLSNIRNEINNPLNAIMGLADQLASIVPDRPEAVQMAAMIHEEAFNLDFQMRNIFMAAELEAGTVEATPTLLRLDSLLAEVLDNFRTKAAQKRISLTGSTQKSDDSTDDQVTCDGEKLALIISNLVANAIEFNHEEGRVTVSLKADADGLSLQVEDTGIGILEEDIPRIFDRFSQLDSGSTRPHPGQGLGLSVVKALIDLLGGRIQVVSRPQQGTQFTVWLPWLHTEPGEKTFSVGGTLFLFDSEQDLQ